MKDTDKIKTNMDKIDTYPKLILSLVLLELILSAILFAIGHLTNNAYIRGVGVGLVIAWVTSALAYFIVRKRSK